MSQRRIIPRQLASSAQTESVRPRPLEHRGDGLEQNRDVAGDGPVLDVGDIGELGLLLREVAAPGDLPRAGDAGLDEQAGGVERAVSSDFLWQRRTGTDKAHVAKEHIEELGEFIQRGLADEVSDLRNTWIVLEFEDEAVLDTAFFGELGFDRIGVRAHGTELVHGERSAVNADSRLRVEHRTAILLVHLIGDPQHKGGAENNCHRGKHDIADPLEDTSKRRVLGEPCGKHRHHGIVARVQIRAAQIRDGCRQSQLDAHGLHCQRKRAHGFGISGKHVGDQHGSCLQPLCGLRQVRVKCQDLQLRFLVIGRFERNRDQVLRLIRIIFIAHRGHGAYRNGEISDATVLAKLLDSPMNAFRGSDDDGRIIEFAFHAVPVKRAPHDPAFNDDQDQGDDGDEDVQRTRQIEVE